MTELLILILITLFGIQLTRLIVNDIPRTNNYAIGFLVGLGLTTFISFVLSWLGIKITYESVLATVLSLCLILLLRGSNVYGKNDNNNFSMYEKVVLGLIAFALIISFAISIYYPITAWDALALYDFRAKVIADTGYFVQVANQFNYFSHYPLFTSMSHSFIYLSGGTNPQFLYSLYLVAFAASLYSLLKMSVSRSVSLISTLILVLTPELFEHSTIAYTNLPYTIFYVLGIVCLYVSYLKNRHDYLLLAGILIGLSTWVRADLPFWITGVIFAIIASFRSKKIQTLFIYMLPFLIIQQTWNHFASSVFGGDYSTVGQLSSAGISILNSNNIYRIYEVFGYLYQNVFLNWSYLFILFAISVLIDLKNKIKENTGVLLAMILINFIGLFVGTYIFSFKVSEWREIADSASRMSMFFPPLMIYYISLVVNLNLYIKK